MTTLSSRPRRRLIVGCALGSCLFVMTACSDPSGSTEPATQDDLFELSQTESIDAGHEDGFRLGESGNVVLTGHVVEHSTGGPGGLWNIESVAPGDDVIVTTSDGAPADYVVTDVKIHVGSTYGTDGPVLQQIFGSADSENLNILTHQYASSSADRQSVLVMTTRLDD